MEPRSHHALRDLLPGYAANQLPPSERATVERHAATCADCRAELREWITLGDWLTQAEAAIPPDTGAPRGLAAIHARLRQPPASRTAAYGRDGFGGFGGLERSARPTMPNNDLPRYPADQEETRPSPALREWRPSTGPSGGAPSRLSQPPQRRIRTSVAVASVAVFLALAASLFYLLAPRGRPHNNVATQPTATTRPAATTQPTATPPPLAGTWSPPEDLPANAFTTMAFALSDPRTGYFCAHISPATATSAKWLYKTSDGGVTWRALSGISIPSVSQPVSMRCDIFIDPNDANDVFAQLLLSSLEGSLHVVSDTLWRSRDGGGSWSQVSQPQLNNGWINIVVVGSRIVALADYDQQVPPVCSTDPTTLYPHQLDYLYASDNGGATWTKIGQSLTSQGSSIAISTGNSALTSAGSTLFVQTYCAASQGSSSGDQYATWRSTDGGVTWSKMSLLNNPVAIQGFTRATSGSYAGVAVELGSGSPSTTSAFPKALYSADAGVTWKALPPLSDLPGLKIASGSTSVWMMALPDGNVLAAVTVVDPATNAVTGAMFATDPRAASPTWRRYASFDHIFAGGLALTGQGLKVWGLTGDLNQRIVFLSPLP